MEALGLSSSVLANARDPKVLALPSLSLVKGSDSAVVLGASDSVTEQAHSKGLLYGAYHNVLIPTVGITALWNGIIAAATSSSSSTPSVVVGKHSALATPPDNLIAGAGRYVFVEEGVSKVTSLSESEAVKRQVTDILFLKRILCANRSRIVKRVTTSIFLFFLFCLIILSFHSVLPQYIFNLVQFAIN